MFFVLDCHSIHLRHSLWCLYEFLVCYVALSNSLLHSCLFPSSPLASFSSPSSLSLSPLLSLSLLRSQHLCRKGSGDIVKRWVNEVQEALSSDNVMVQYHAMGLLYHIRKHDRLAVSKMVTKLTRSSMRSAHGYCLLVSLLIHFEIYSKFCLLFFQIRIACQVMEEEERS